MKVVSANFIQSVPDYKLCPPPLYPEYAFIGRSNVGKSSLINNLTNRKKLARISVSPGKTRLINHFLINDRWYLVDLPGYGYAKASKTLRKSFGRLITNYLQNRPNLLCTFLLIDSRIEPQKIDLAFMEWMATKELPFNIVFTKTDKLGKQQLHQNLMNYKEILSKSWDELPPSIITSAHTGLGREDILGFIEETNQIFDPSRLADEGKKRE